MMRRIIFSILILSLAVACQPNDSTPNDSIRNEGEGERLPDFIDMHAQVSMKIDGMPLNDYLAKAPDEVTFFLQPDGDSSASVAGSWMARKFGSSSYKPSMIWWENADNVILHIRTHVITSQSEIGDLEEVFPNSYANKALMGPMNEYGEDGYLLHLSDEKDGYLQMTYFQGQPKEFVLEFPR